MGELINGRTPEEIKAALKRCGRERCKSDKTDDCPYYIDCLVGATRMKLMKNALALIERLESERDAALTKVPKWIKTKDKLPPRELKVLAVNGHGHIKVMAFWKKEKERWTWIENSRFTHRNDITHWMPLPEAPEVKE